MAFQADQIVGEYKIVRTLGQGGLGTVYEAVHRISQRSDAMKVIRAEQIDGSDLTERFRREIQLLASLNHPHIAGLHNAFYHEGQLVMIMELVQGEDLRSLSRRSRIELPLLLDFANQALDALGYAHGRGVVHRDIKPANLMVSPGNSVKVLDFGIAISEQSAELTAAGSFIGSPAYMAPEQFRGEKATAQSDIYSFGVTLYELIAGQLPLEGPSLFEFMNAHLHKPPAALGALRPDIPLHLSTAIGKALEKDPLKRYRTATEFQMTLRTHDVSDMTQTMTAIPASWQRISTDELRQPTPVSAVLPVEPVVRHLAGFIGPIAKIVVGRLAKQCTSVDQLYLEAAREIENESERQKFLRTRPH